jgi:predicted dehydrogenase
MIKWGIIGCGDVTELKSGPAFNKVTDSKLIAVMRRTESKAKDYALRHHVSKYYSKAIDLINDPEINAIYIATPPDSHEIYTLAAIEAGKSVYVEKPMTLDHHSAKRMMNASEKQQVKLVVAHYRNAQPMFIKIKELLQDNIIGKVLQVRLNYSCKAIASSEMTESKIAWRINPLQSGGGFFHDLAPHQIGLMVYFFGNPIEAYGISGNRVGLYDADDTVNGIIKFENGIQFCGNWFFNGNSNQTTDEVEIIGTTGSILFSVFNEQQIRISSLKGKEIISFPLLEHVQQPMIDKVVQYFLGTSKNPCAPLEGYVVMKVMDAFTKKGFF